MIDDAPDSVTETEEVDNLRELIRAEIDIYGLTQEDIIYFKTVSKECARP